MKFINFPVGYDFDEELKKKLVSIEQHEKQEVLVSYVAENFDNIGEAFCLTYEKEDLHNLEYLLRGPGSSFMSRTGGRVNTLDQAKHFMQSIQGINNTAELQKAEIKFYQEILLPDIENMEKSTKKR